MRTRAIAVLAVLAVFGALGLQRSHLARAASTHPIPVLISTDLATGLVNGSRPGPSDIDDGLAAAMALHAHRLNVRGIILTFGNNDAGAEFRAAKHIVRTVLHSKVPVRQGAAVPLSVPQVQWYNQKPVRAACMNDGVRLMAKELRRQRMTVVALGPLTDIGCLIQNDYYAAMRVNRVVAIMGRAPGQNFVINGHSGLTDFNFRTDPRAVSILLGTRIPVTFMTFALTSSTFIPTSTLSALQHRGTIGTFFYQAMQPWLGFWNQVFGESGFHPWDQNAVYHLLAPKACSCGQTGFAIIPCVNAPPGTPACAGHGPSQPASLNSETAQLWLGSGYQTRTVSACTGYASAAAKATFQRAAIRLVTG
jgi:pyrimidine-specific ribonucleoside hydrolase